MANVSVLLSLLLISATIYLTKSEEVKLYTDKYDHVNYDEILSNDRLRNQYYNCAMGTSRCLSDDATFFKDKFPEALVTKCKYCTEPQKIGFDKIVTYYTEKEPEKWKAVLEKTIKDIQKKPKE